MLANDYFLLRFRDERLPVIEQLAVMPSQRECIEVPTPFCAIKHEDVDIEAVVTHSVMDRGRLTLTIQAGRAACRLDVWLEKSSLKWRFSVDASGEVVVMFPFIRHIDGESLSASGQVDVACLPTAQANTNGPQLPLPATWPIDDRRSLTALVIGEGPKDLRDVASTLAGASFLCDSKRSVDGELAVHAGGWRQAFDLFRMRVRARLNKAEYARPELAWQRDQWLHHFTFLYGHEILNLTSGKLDVDRLLDNGEQVFGGYDGILLWGAYPRIGIDARSQWDIYDDLPGGRPGIRALVERAHSRGTRVYLPYLPWDMGTGRGDRRGDHLKLAEVVSDLDVDGVFLDTMSAVAPEFRLAVDNVRPGVAFCSEGRAVGDAFEMITSSWDQTSIASAAEGVWSMKAEPLPSVDLWRFVFPEHRSFVISRHALGAERCRMIRRGLLEGKGWVVWQDVFGLALPYTPGESHLLKKCLAIARKNSQALNGVGSTPFIRTLVPGVYAHEFVGAERRMWTVYNDTDETVNTPVLAIDVASDRRLVDEWRDIEVPTDADGQVALVIDPGDVGVVAELPRRDETR